MRFKYRKPTTQSFTIGFLGDTVPGFPEFRPIKICQRLLELLSSCDLVIANLESPLTTAPSVREDGYSSLYSDPISISELKALNVNLVNLANNHIFDRGHTGLEETLNTLKQNGISWIGAGNDIKQASRHFLFKKKDMQISFLGYCSSVLDRRSIASGNKAGANPLILKEAKERIASLREKGHIVCTSYHGGWEFYRIPCPKHRAILKELAEAGSHLVIGHHAHVFQGIEASNGGIIAYGLGNFYMNTKFQVNHRGTDIGMVLTVEIDRLGLYAYTVNFVHNQRSSRKLSIIQGHKRNELLVLFKHISEIMNHQKQYINEWNRDCCRIAFGMHRLNNKLWFLRLTRILAKLPYRVCKSALKAIRRLRKEKNRINQHHKSIAEQSSTLKKYYATLRGLPTIIRSFRSFGQCYKDYDMRN